MKFPHNLVKFQHKSEKIANNLAILVLKNVNKSPEFVTNMC